MKEPGPKVVIQLAEGPQLPGWAAAASVEPAAAGVRLKEQAEDCYQAAWNDGELLSFQADGAYFVYDTAGLHGDGREPRPVAGWTVVPGVAPTRDKSRQAGHPLAPRLLAAGFERGHLVARAAGGGLDANLFPQAWQVNQGRSSEGREFRRLERLAAANPGALTFTRLVYGDESTVPTFVHLLVALPGGPVAQGMFRNVPEPRAVTSARRLSAGSRFHRYVQTAFLAGLPRGVAAPERTVRLADLRQGRVDLLVVPTKGERTCVVVEIKNTDWDALPAHRVRRNLLAHVRQLQKYLDPLVDEMDQGVWDSVTGVLLYPSAPREAARRVALETMAAERALSLVWHDEADW